MDITIDKIIRAKRKSICISVTDEAALVVRAPFRVSEDEIVKAVSKHRIWIDKKLEEVKSRGAKHLHRRFETGEKFLYLGEYYSLSITGSDTLFPADKNNDGLPIKFDEGFYLSGEYRNNAREILTCWYKEKACETIPERVKLHAAANGFKCGKINITSAVTRWGSCSFKGNLNFSWRLIMAPFQVIDYVAIHELAHLKEKNHSKSFWNVVKMLMPDYKMHNAWLRSNGYLLKF